MPPGPGPWTKPTVLAILLLFLFLAPMLWCICGNRMENDKKNLGSSYHCGYVLVYVSFFLSASFFLLKVHY